jgi:hypothetical protein
MRARRWLLVILGVVVFPLAAQQPGAAPPAQNSANSSQLQELPLAPPASQAELQSLSQDTLGKKQNAAASEDSHAKEAVGEEDLAKILFEGRTKTPDSPEPKAGVTETNSCPGGVGNPCALLGGWVYYPDQLRLTYHERTWWDAMKPPGMLGLSALLVASTVFDAKGSQACIDKHTCQELNPLMQGSIAEKLAVGMSLNAITIFAAVREKQHGRGVLPAMILSVASGGHIYFGWKGYANAKTH